MRSLVLASAFFALSMPFTASISHAGEISFCGTPDTVTVSNDTIGVCDIYSRQLAYRLKANALRASIEERQQYFLAPAREARQRYEQALKALNEQRIAENK